MGAGHCGRGAEAEVLIPQRGPEKEGVLIPQQGPLKEGVLILQQGPWREGVGGVKLGAAAPEGQWLPWKEAAGAVLSA